MKIHRKDSDEFVITTHGQYPAYREPGNFVEVVAFPNSLVAFAIDEFGKHVRRIGDMNQPPHWGIWQGVVHVSAYSPDTSIFDLMGLLRRGQTALRCKENQPNLNPRR